MPVTVKAPLRPFEYMAWAKAVPRGARYNLTASGMADAALSTSHGDVAAPRSPDDPSAELGWADAMARRDVAWDSIDALTQAVAERYDVETSLVTPTLGASLAITHALIALVRAGDHVVVERPTYEPLHRAPEILGAQVSRLERTHDDGWAVVPERLAQLLTSRTKAVLLTNLHNPSGVAMDAANLKAIAELAARVGALVLVDEVYLDFDFSVAADAPIQPACRVAPNCISWSSTTKAFGHSSHVEQDGVDIVLLERRECLRATVGFDHIVAVGTQDLSNHAANLRFVVDDEDASSLGRGYGMLLHRTVIVSFPLGPGQSVVTDW